MPKVIDEKVRARAVRLVQEHRSEYSTESKVMEAVARQEGVGKESLRRWVNQAEVDSGARPGTTSAELEEIKKLKAENKRLREDVAILKAATSFFVGNSTPATDDLGFHRHASCRGPCGRVDLPGAARAGLPGRRTDLPLLGQGSGQRPHGLGRAGRRRRPPDRVAV